MRSLINFFHVSDKIVPYCNIMVHIKLKLCPTRKGLQKDLLPVGMCNFHGFCCPLHRLTYLGKVKKAPCKNNKKKLIIIALALIFLFCMHYEEIPILLHQESSYSNLQIFSLWLRLFQNRSYLRVKQNSIEFFTCISP